MPKCKYKSIRNKITKEKAEKNKNQKKKRKLTFLGNFPFQPFPFPAPSLFGRDPTCHFPFLSRTRPIRPVTGPKPSFLSPPSLSLWLTSGPRATVTGRSSSSSSSAPRTLSSLSRNRSIPKISLLEMILSSFMLHFMHCK